MHEAAATPAWVLLAYLVELRRRHNAQWKW